MSGLSAVLARLRAAGLALLGHTPKAAPPAPLRVQPQPYEAGYTNRNTEQTVALAQSTAPEVTSAQSDAAAGFADWAQTIGSVAAVQAQPEEAIGATALAELLAAQCRRYATDIAAQEAL